MRAPKEVAEKAVQYTRYSNLADALFEDLEFWAVENGVEDFMVTGFWQSFEPYGEKQSDGRYIDQKMDGEDYGHGSCYIPVEDSREYLVIDYSF